MWRENMRRVWWENECQSIGKDGGPAGDAKQVFGEWLTEVCQAAGDLWAGREMLADETPRAFLDKCFMNYVEKTKSGQFYGDWIESVVTYMYRRRMERRGMRSTPPTPSERKAPWHGLDMPPPPKRKEDETAQKQREDEAAKKKKEDEDAAKKREEVNMRKAEEEAAQKKKEDEEAAKKKKEDEMAKKKAQEEAAQKKKEDEEAAKKKREEEEAAKKKREEEQAAQRKKAEDAALKRAEEEAAQKKREDEEAAKKNEEQKKTEKEKEIEEESGYHGSLHGYGYHGWWTQDAWNDYQGWKEGWEDDWEEWNEGIGTGQASGEGGNAPAGATPEEPQGGDGGGEKDWIGSK